MPATYIEAIGEYFPNVQATAPTGSMEYEDLVWLSGDPLPSKTELDARRRQLDQDRMWRRIQAERDRRRAGGVRIGTNWFHSDDTSRIQQLGLLLMGANMPPNIMWKTMGNNFVLMTPTLAQQIFQATGTQDMQIFAVAEQHRAQMMAAANPTTYNFMTGWPPTFGE